MVKRALTIAAWTALVLMACTRPSASRYPAGISPAPTYAAAPAVDARVTRRIDSSAEPRATPLTSSVDRDSATLVEARPSQNDALNTTKPPGPPPAVDAPLPFQQMNHGSHALRPKVVARRFANLSPSSCSKELRHWKDSFKRVGAHKGIATPTRVIGPVEGVRFRVPGEKSKFGILDCRLALTLVEFARFLRARDVTEVVVDNFYRLNARLPSARSKRSQHAYGLAIDLRSFRLADGRVWDVEKDWGASTDTEACGPEATLVAPTEHTEGLRTLVCEMFAEQLFSHHLTPSHDAAHRNHLHLDIKRGATTAIIK